MTTGPENPYGEQEPSTPPPAPSPYGTPPPIPPPTPSPYGAPSSYQQQPYQQPYQQPGYGQAPYPYAMPTPPTDGLALGSMITGIAALVLMCLYGIGLLASPVALVLGKVSLNRIKRSQGQLGGRGLALTGFILGIIGTVLLVIAVIVVVIVIIVAIQDPNAFDD